MVPIVRVVPARLFKVALQGAVDRRPPDGTQGGVPASGGVLRCDRYMHVLQKDYKKTRRISSVTANCTSGISQNGMVVRGAHVYVYIHTSKRADTTSNFSYGMSLNCTCFRHE